jgi:hypothetical protein
MFRPIIILAATLALCGCDVAGLVAHTVKQVEKNREQPVQPAAASRGEAQAQPAVQRQAVEEPPAPVSPVVPRPEAVTIEALPAR